jgi:hypothetical protein
MMNFRDIPRWEAAIKTRVHCHDHCHAGQAHFRQHTMSRRQFARTAAGVVVVGATLGAGVWRPGPAEARGSNEPVPIPGGFQAGGQTFHVFGPGLNGNPPDQEPITITDFNGFVGLAYLDGMVTQTNTQTGQIRRLPFLTSDMRFMQGVFCDTEGLVHQGAFALV